MTHLDPLANHEGTCETVSEQGPSTSYLDGLPRHHNALYATRNDAPHTRNASDILADLQERSVPLDSEIRFGKTKVHLGTVENGKLREERMYDAEGNIVSAKEPVNYVKWTTTDTDGNVKDQWYPVAKAIAQWDVEDATFLGVAEDDEDLTPSTEDATFLGYTEDDELSALEELGDDSWNS